MNKQAKYISIPLILLALLLSNCNEVQERHAINMDISRPIDIKTDSEKEVFYILNSNMAGDFKDGSILLVDKSGNKLEAFSTPSLGRSLYVNNNLAQSSGSKQRLLASFEGGQDDSQATIQVYDLSNAKKPQLEKTWNIEGRPANAVLDETGTKIAVSCYDGELYLGSLEDEDPSNWSLKHIRTYPGPLRRAMVFRQGMLYLFVTFPLSPLARDQIYQDTKTFDDKGEVTDENTPDGMPDKFAEENYAFYRKQTSFFHFVTLDVELALSETENSSVSLPKSFKETQSELKWLYFNLEGADSSLDTGSADSEKGERFYRTNFWQATPHIDGDKFYLSQRGGYSENSGKISSLSNNVLLFEIKAEEEAGVENGYFNVERYFGYEESLHDVKRSYVGAFDLLSYGSENIEQNLLVVNHFRGPDMSSDPYYSLTSLVPKDPSKDNYKIKSSEKMEGSYYSVAVGDGGVILSSFFYANKLVLLDSELNIIKEINSE
tara:strand:- start:445 stop:1917 length:1473 start_codon:yes stop_codon:yes gene_type:complete